MRSFDELVDEADVVDVSGWARCRMEFFDVGAIVYVLRKCVWWGPDFAVERYRTVLRQLDGHIREHGLIVAHSTRTLFDARRESR